MTLEVRTIQEPEVNEWLAAKGRGFLFFYTNLEEEALIRRPWMDLERTYAGFDGERIVSTLRSFPTTLTLPGGATPPTSGVTAVTTTATHRRRGLATQMVTQDLRDSVERGEHAAVLIAAEWGIYGRFGYGPATEHQTLTLDTRGTRLRLLPSGTVEYVEASQARVLVPDIFDAHRRRQPGELTWDDSDWDYEHGLVRLAGVGDAPSFHIIARDESGQPVGFARYRYQENWDRRQAAGSMTVKSLIGVDVNAQALLWQHLIEHDLTVSAVVEDRSPADSLPLLLEDPRQVVASGRADFVWVRPLDAAALLAARTYAVAGSLVIDVVDPLGITNGRFHLEAGPDGATCSSSNASADITMPVATLGSLILGGSRVRGRALAEVGLLDEHVAGAVGRLDLMFGSAVEPWSSRWF